MDSFWASRRTRPAKVQSPARENSAMYPASPFELMGGGPTANRPVEAQPRPAKTVPMGQNLLKLYGLDRLSSQFERHDPITRVKKNKLRKSYVGKLRDREIRFKVQAIDSFDEVFAPALFMPDDQWDHLNGFKIDDAVHKLTGPDFGSRADRVVGGGGLAPGRHPEWKNWSPMLCMTDDQLKTDFERKRDADRQRAQASAAPSPAGGVAANPPPGSASRPAAKPDQARPAVRRRFGESANSPRRGPTEDDARSRVPPSAAIGDMGVSGGPNSAALAKKKKRIISRVDGMRVGVMAADQ